MRSLLEYVYAVLWEYVFIVNVWFDFLLSSKCKAYISCAASFRNICSAFFKPA